MGIKLIKKTNEAVYKAIRNPGQAAFLIDCGTPEKAKELNDAFYAVAFKDNGWTPNKEVLGGELVQGWNVGPYFTACVDPCDKAAKWCEEWLRNSGGSAPGIQGNAAGLEGKQAESKSKGRPKATDGRVHQFAFDFVITGNDTLGDVEDRIRNEIDLIDGIAKVSNGDSETSWSEAEYFGEGKRNLERKACEELPPKLALRHKYRTIDAALKDMEAFTKVLGVTASDLHDKGFDLDMGSGRKSDCLKEAKKALSDFDECLDYSVVSEMEDGKPYWYVVIKFKPEFWEYPDADIISTLTMLDDAILEYC